jgi:hypothetical protein
MSQNYLRYQKNLHLQFVQRILMNQSYLHLPFVQKIPSYQKNLHLLFVQKILSYQLPRFVRKILNYHWIQILLRLLLNLLSMKHRYLNHILQIPLKLMNLYLRYKIQHRQ